MKPAMRRVAAAPPPRFLTRQESSALSGGLGGLHPRNDPCRGMMRSQYVAATQATHKVVHGRGGQPDTFGKMSQWILRKMRWRGAFSPA
jgi:hypothetical protein